MDLISVVIPIYKVEQYLRRCIDSVLIQTYNNLEIILVNDGSPDNCGIICEEYAKIDSRIKVIHKKNGGLSEARNVGIDIAKGSYITFLDSDDWISKYYIETLYKNCKESDSEIAICNFYKTEIEQLQVEVNDYSYTIMSNYEALDALFSSIGIQMTVAWGKLYKMELFEDIRFPIGMLHEDEFTTYKLLYKSKKIVYTNNKLLYYWQRVDSIMGATPKLKNKVHAFKAYQERLVFFIEKNLEGNAVSMQRNIIFFIEHTDRKLYKMEDFDLMKNEYLQLKDEFFKLYPTVNCKKSIKFLIGLYKFSPLLFRGLLVLNKFKKILCKKKVEFFSNFSHF